LCQYIINRSIILLLTNHAIWNNKLLKTNLFDDRHQTYISNGFNVRRFRTGFKGTINAQQTLHKRRILANITKAFFHPKKVNKKRESGPNVIEPIPVPAVTIPKNKTRAIT